MKPNKKRLTCPGSTDTPAPTQGENSAASMTSKELEELKYDTAVAMLKGMSDGSVFQFALDRQLQLLDDYSPETLKHLFKQYKITTSGGGF